jgi:hypothetical protein
MSLDKNMVDAVVGQEAGQCQAAASTSDNDNGDCDLGGHCVLFGKWEFAIAVTWRIICLL